MSSERSLIVRGIPVDKTADDVELFFESDRFCPSGGRVEKVEDAVDGRATVTFADACGKYYLNYIHYCHITV